MPEERYKYYIADAIDVDKISDAAQRERVAALIIAINEGKITLMELWQRFSASIKGQKILNDDYWDIPIVVASIFEIPQAKDINESIEALLTRLETIEAHLRNHRHDNTKSFSAKAEW